MNDHGLFKQYEDESANDERRVSKIEKSVVLFWLTKLKLKF